jgi:hypothetical protein
MPQIRAQNSCGRRSEVAPPQRRGMSAKRRWRLPKAVRAGSALLYHGNDSGVEGSVFCLRTHQVWCIEDIKDLLERPRMLPNTLKYKSFSRFAFTPNPTLPYAKPHTSLRQTPHLKARAYAKPHTPGPVLTPNPTPARSRLRQTPHPRRAQRFAGGRCRTSDIGIGAGVRRHEAF